MGILDDAIRDHLDLKRRHGASEAEIAQAEAEALGPARREPAVSPYDELLAGAEVDSTLTAEPSADETIFQDPAGPFDHMEPAGEPDPGTVVYPPDADSTYFAGPEQFPPPAGEPPPEAHVPPPAEDLPPEAHVPPPAEDLPPEAHVPLPAEDLPPE